ASSRLRSKSLISFSNSFKTLAALSFLSFFDRFASNSTCTRKSRMISFTVQQCHDFVTVFGGAVGPLSAAQAGPLLHATTDVIVSARIRPHWFMARLLIRSPWGGSYHCLQQFSTEFLRASATLSPVSSLPDLRLNCVFRRAFHPAATSINAPDQV